MKQLLAVVTCFMLFVFFGEGGHMNVVILYLVLLLFFSSSLFFNDFVFF